MKIGIQTLTKARGAWHTFRNNHPGFVPFMDDVFSKGIREDMQIEITVQQPDGSKTSTGIRVKQGDLELFKIMQDVFS